ncbi:FAD-dependent oxidoreductase [Paracoccus gahaiensis]|nr:FAD-dependent oxidoreductase [Paracoccus gahaiensis]
MPGDAPRILLLGAGHANLLAVRPLRAGLPRARITLVDAGTHATYSGMVPGHLAGHYAAADLRVDLADFAARHGLVFLRARVEGMDPATRSARLAPDPAGGDRSLHYDLAVLDLGSQAAMPEIAGFDRHAVPVKPLDGLLARLADLPPGAPVAIIGGGVAGAEIALALTHRRAGMVTLIEAGPDLAASLRPRARAHLRRALDRAGVRAITQARIIRIEARGVTLQDGTRIASALTIGSAGARAQGWWARDLPVEGAGFLRVTPTLQVEGHPTLFAAGDCAAMLHAPRPKAGVFAVRQAPVLAQNLIAAHRGTALRRYDPQRHSLKIVSLGGRTALAEWRGLTLHGAWLWRWKDRIDRRFIAGLRGA